MNEPSMSAVSDGPGRTYREELITPEIAKAYLVENTHNRRTKGGRIHAYADAMKNGMWRVNGEAIKFSRSGRLIDGQNRLLAVIHAGVPVTMLVVRGLDDQDQEAMDLGATRTMSDILTLRGEKCTHTLAATIRALYLWDTTEDPAKRTVGGSGQGGGNSRWLAATDLLAYFDSNTELCRYISSKCDHYRKVTRIPASVLAPLYREMQRIDADDAEDFLYRVENVLPSPKNLGENDPIVQLHKRMRQMFDQSKSKYVTTELGALIVKAWNAYRDGTEVAQLRWRSGGNAPEAFPVMK